MYKILLFGLCFSFLSCHKVAIADNSVVIVPNFLDQAYTFVGKRDDVAAMDDTMVPKLLKKIKEIFTEKGYALSSKEMNFNEEELAMFYMTIPVPNSYEEFEANLLFWGAVDLRNNVLKIQVVAVETARSLSYYIDLDNLRVMNFESQILNAVSVILHNEAIITEILNVRADKIIDPYNSVLQYVVQDDHQSTLGIDIDYDGLHQVIQSFSCDSSSPDKPDAWVKVTSDDGHSLYLQCATNSTDKGTFNVKTDYKPEIHETGKDFTISSQNGYKLNVNIRWDGGGIELADIEPLENPYTPYYMIINEDGTITRHYDYAAW